MNLKYIPQFEIGKRAYVAVLAICFALIIVAICSLAIYTIYLTSLRKTNTRISPQSSTSLSTNSTDYIYNISALLAPDALRKEEFQKK